MALDRITVGKMATLARLRVDDGALDGLAGELSKIIGWVETLAEVDTQGVEPMTSAAETSLLMRKDEVTEGNLEDKVLLNAPEAAHGFYTVPKVVE
jgi:aspartyl-tRNA(Asn)/glutamyl-tRNA(Gln) amidotransferase subunit C